MIAVIVKDLFFRVKIEETAKHRNTRVSFIENLENIGSVKKIIVDLNAVPVETIKQAKTGHPDVYIIGYLSHTQTALRAKAEAAGCDLVLAQSEFTKRLPELLTKN